MSTQALYIAGAATAGPPDDVAVCEVGEHAILDGDYLICDHGVTQCYGCLCRECRVEVRRP